MGFHCKQDAGRPYNCLDTLSQDDTGTTLYSAEVGDTVALDGEGLEKDRAIRWITGDVCTFCSILIAESGLITPDQG